MGRCLRIWIAIGVCLLATTPARVWAQPADRPSAEAEEESLVLPEVAAAGIDEAQTALDNDDPQRAIEILRPLLEDNPDFRPAQGLLGVAKLMQGEIDAGRALIDALPEQPASFHAVGRAVSVLEETDIDRAIIAPYRERAMKLAQLAAAQQVEDPTPYLYIATMASRQRDLSELRRATEVLISRFPDEEQGHFLAALVAGSEGDWATHDAQLQEAERLGMPAEIIAEARADALRAQAATAQTGRRWLIGGGILVAILAIVFYRRGTRSSDRDDKIPAA